MEDFETIDFNLRGGELELLDSSYLIDGFWIFVVNKEIYVFL